MSEPQPQMNVDLETFQQQNQDIVTLGDDGEVIPLSEVSQKKREETEARFTLEEVQEILQQEVAGELERSGLLEDLTKALEKEVHIRISAMMSALIVSLLIVAHKSSEARVSGGSIDVGGVALLLIVAATVIATIGDRYHNGVQEVIDDLTEQLGIPESVSDDPEELRAYVKAAQEQDEGGLKEAKKLLESKGYTVEK